MNCKSTDVSGYPVSVEIFSLLGTKLTTTRKNSLGYGKSWQEGRRARVVGGWKCVRHSFVLVFACQLCLCVFYNFLPCLCPCDVCTFNRRRLRSALSAYLLPFCTHPLPTSTTHPPSPSCGIQFFPRLQPASVCCVADMSKKHILGLAQSGSRSASSRHTKEGVGWGQGNDSDRGKFTSKCDNEQT